MEWIKGIDYKKHLTGDLKELEEIVGIDVFIKLMSAFAKTTIYFSEKPLMDMKRDFIKKNFGFIGDKELARKMGVSERLIYKIAQEKYDLQQEELFQ